MTDTDPHVPGKSNMMPEIMAAIERGERVWTGDPDELQTPALMLVDEYHDLVADPAEQERINTLLQRMIREGRDPRIAEAPDIRIRFRPDTHEERP